MASEGVFGRPLRPEWLTALSEEWHSRISYAPIAESATQGIAETAMDQQTLTSKQTGDSDLDRLWKSTMKSLEPNIPSATFHTFLQDLRLVSLEDGAVVLGTSRPWVQQWVEVQMRNRIRLALELELRLGGDSRKVDTIRCIVISEE